MTKLLRSFLDLVKGQFTRGNQRSTFWLLLLLLLLLLLPAADTVAAADAVAAAYAAV